MALVQRDFILRMIEAVAAALTRVVQRKRTGDLAGAQQEVAAAAGELLGPSAPMARLVDPRTAANIVGDARRITLWCRLLAEERELLELLGRTAESAAVDQRIVALLLEAWRREPEWDAETRAVFNAARARGGGDALDGGHRAALEAWDEANRR